MIRSCDNSNYITFLFIIVNLQIEEIKDYVLSFAENSEKSIASGVANSSSFLKKLEQRTNENYLFKIDFLLKMSFLI
jgi:hypothetical protein